MTYSVTTIDAKGRAYRITADAILSPSDFNAVAHELGCRPAMARKIACVFARRADRTERVETHWNGRETSNTAQPGDWIVTNLAPDGAVLRDRDGHANVYVISATKFPRLYERASETGENQFYRSKAIVETIPLAGGFDIVAPWGERQRAAAGYLLRNADDVYGNNTETFEATYHIIAK